MKKNEIAEGIGIVFYLLSALCVALAFFYAAMLHIEISRFMILVAPVLLLISFLLLLYNSFGSVKSTSTILLEFLPGIVLPISTYVCFVFLCKYVHLLLIYK